jgi:hypothetical protein
VSAPLVSARTRQAQDYLAAVEHELGDLSAEDRDALVEDLALHLEALAAEDDDRPLAVRLGEPAAYAADLRAAAGLPARPAADHPASPGLQQWLARVRSTAAHRRARPVLREIRRLLADLRPAWWVLRGYLVVLLPSLLAHDGVRDFPVPAPGGSHVLGGLLVLAAVVGSVILGRRSLSRPMAAVVALAGAALAVTTLVVVQSAAATVTALAAAHNPWPDPLPEAAQGKYPLLSRHGPVTNVLPYAADGTPLEGVLLYDQDGRPLRVGLQEWWADHCARVLDHPRAADGVAVPNSYPQSYRLDPAGTDLNGAPVDRNQCRTEVPRPEVPLPSFPRTGG